MKKIVSLISNNRTPRKGEKNNIDYIFIPKAELLAKKENGELLQFLEFKGVFYGYEKSEFDGVEHLFIICGGSGAGKDSIFYKLVDDCPPSLAGDGIRFLFSVPKTIPVFVSYCKENNIPFTIVYLHVSEEERARHILDGMLKEEFNGEYFVENICHGESNDFLVSLNKPLKDSDKNKYDKIYKEMFARVTRDRANPFDIGIKNLEKDGFTVRWAFLNYLSFKEAFDSVKNLLLKAIEK